MGASESDKHNIYKKTNANRLFALDEFLGDNSEGLNMDTSLSLSEDLQKILEERKLYSFNQMSNVAYTDKPEQMSYIDAWYTKKRRRPYVAPWSYVPEDKSGMYEQDIAPYMSRKPETKKQKMCLGVMKKPAPMTEKSTLNSILPLYLNSTTSFEGPSQKKEFLKISDSFMNRVSGIDYDALTVQQLKSIMKEFGLSYTGKKHELINRIQQTCHKIKQKQTQDSSSAYLAKDSSALSPSLKESIEAEIEKTEEKSSLGFMFF
ncbi:hypothetical protein NEMIN01_1946 [Nematocida minor]|uniref:uncharacterized protein n=1 Tax=Nematocida minor TaxID=1912983 RepID=UPI00221E5B1F|nr:uncharacterized protein NEMIN01_1946 [Nematocida minor]KAI5192317.1 hypothetical protein NEMIN01_1946 [Nematocida minor]